jgi:flavin reductase (DIM6/NTAB) family NADH-FMN oxidoreductase RutF
MISPYISKSLIESAVGLVIVNAGDVRNAMTVSLYSEVAHHPTALWVSIAKQSFTHKLLHQHPEFALAVLNNRQGGIANRCGNVSGRDQDKCSSLDLYLNPKGFLFLHGALASTSCRVRKTVELGDHTLWIADILETQLESRTSHRRQLLLSDLKT